MNIKINERYEKLFFLCQKHEKNLEIYEKSQNSVTPCLHIFECLYTFGCHILCKKCDRKYAEIQDVQVWNWGIFGLFQGVWYLQIGGPENILYSSLWIFQGKQWNFKI